MCIVTVHTGAESKTGNLQKQNLVINKLSHSIKRNAGIIIVECHNYNKTFKLHKLREATNHNKRNRGGVKKSNKNFEKLSTSGEKRTA